MMVDPSPLWGGGGDSSTEGEIRSRGRETRNKEVRHGTEDGRQGTET
jgi:hypothetical protein